MRAIRKIFPSPPDFANLSRLRTEAECSVDPVDYSGVIVNKPWGYEYLWYQNDVVAVWLLHLRKGASTSLHCHVRKRTSLIVLDGRVVCSTLEDVTPLGQMGAVVLEPCVFHSSQAVSEEGAFLLEVETPPLKGDLVRLKDAFGRVGSGYEGASEYSTDFSKYDYAPYEHNLSFRGTTFNLSTFQDGPSIPSSMSECELLVPFQGRMVCNGAASIETGEAILGKTLKHRPFTASKQPLELLQIRRTRN